MTFEERGFAVLAANVVKLCDESGVGLEAIVRYAVLPEMYYFVATGILVARSWRCPFLGVVVFTQQLSVQVRCRLVMVGGVPCDRYCVRYLVYCVLRDVLPRTENAPSSQNDNVLDLTRDDRMKNDN